MKVRIVNPPEVELEGEQVDKDDVIETVAVEVPEALVAVIVYVAELAVVVGVPEIKPVDVEKLNPDTASEGEIEKESAAPAEFVIV